MSLRLPEASPGQHRRTWIALAFLVATATRIVFVLCYPTLHGGDAAARLANASKLVLGYQLPLPQLFVVVGKALQDDPILVRLLFCAWGGILTAAITALLGRAVDARAALFGWLLLAFDPLLVHYSIVPYQEPVAYGLLAWAIYFAATGPPMAGAGLMAAACLCRYEAWLFLPAFLWLTRSRMATLVAATPVVGWIVFWRGFGPTGLYVLDLDPQANRLSRVVFLSRKFIEYETGWILLLASAGLVVVLARRNRSALKALAGLGAVISVIVAFGHEYPPGSGLMSERLIHLPVILALSLSAIALSRLSGSSRLLFHLCIASTLLWGGRSLRFETTLLKAAAQDPDLALAREAARAIEAERSPDECVSVLAPSVDPALLEAYVAKVGAAFGDVRRARERAASAATASPDRDRIAAHLKARTGTVRPESGCPLLLIVDQADGSDPRTNETARTSLAEISAGPRRARLFRIRR